ncbi:hypothetical protein [Galbibacter mesophilus]|uniref:hypothetical protein n=1 Tax=Galbibacter mesophilus TaxID=379069 RepID=UPI00191D1D0F|nr:hypothetical protein [Galbibacter mesophilus]MCM5664336.1 hypothetical protein [Galbibacter mesophilus]
MIRDLKFFNDNGVVISVDISYPMDVYKNASGEAYSDFFDSSSKGVSWVFNAKKIILKNDHTDIFAYPSVDKCYMIVIYEGQNNQFPMPNNAVVYKLDGSIHRVLQIPELLSPKILEKIEEEKHSNPPVEDNRYGHYGQGLQFRGFAWDKDKVGNLINTISIQYAGEYGEWRVFDPQIGEFGELVNDWHQSYGWR